MIDVLSTLQVVLREASFSTHLSSINSSSILSFEDDTLMGFGCLFANPGALLESWKTMELSVLAHYADHFITAGDKAWNVYCIFLCGASADLAQNRQVRWIEEDLERTRKIAACDLSSREDLVRALLPILPLRYQPALRPENATERLQARIQAIAPRASHVVLDKAISPAEVVRMLGERSE